MRIVGTIQPNFCEFNENATAAGFSSRMSKSNMFGAGRSTAPEQLSTPRSPLCARLLTVQGVPRSSPLPLELVTRIRQHCMCGAFIRDRSLTSIRCQRPCEKMITDHQYLHEVLWANACAYICADPHYFHGTGALIYFSCTVWHISCQNGVCAQPKLVSTCHATMSQESTAPA